MLSDLLFHSAGSIVAKGRTRPLEVDDAPALPDFLHHENVPRAFASIDTSDARRFITGVFFATGKPARRIIVLVISKVLLLSLSPILLHNVLEMLPAVSRSPFEIGRAHV